MNEIRLGDLLIAGGPPPAKLVKALAVIAAELHPAFDRDPQKRYPGVSKESCILSSLTVRDFLCRIGFARPTVESVYFIIRAFRDGAQIHGLGIGVPGTKGPGWSGHLVAHCEGWIIDTTLYQAQRPQHWPDLPGMIAVPDMDAFRQGGREIAGTVTADNGVKLEISWTPNPRNRSWKTTPDAQKDRRRQAIDAMARRFGAWRE